MGTIGTEGGYLVHTTSFEHLNWLDRPKSPCWDGRTVDIGGYPTDDVSAFTQTANSVSEDFAEEPQDVDSSGCTYVDNIKGFADELEGVSKVPDEEVGDAILEAARSANVTSLEVQKGTNPGWLNPKKVDKMPGPVMCIKRGAHEFLAVRVKEIGLPCRKMVILVKQEADNLHRWFVKGTIPFPNINPPMSATKILDNGHPEDPSGVYQETVNKLLELLRGANFYYRVC